jgi:hypothetical protein
MSFITWLLGIATGTCVCIAHPENGWAVRRTCARWSIRGRTPRRRGRFNRRRPRRAGLRSQPRLRTQDRPARHPRSSAAGAKEAPLHALSNVRLQLRATGSRLVPTRSTTFPGRMSRSGAALVRAHGRSSERSTDRDGPLPRPNSGAGRGTARAAPSPQRARASCRAADSQRIPRCHSAFRAHGRISTVGP